MSDLDCICHSYKGLPTSSGLCRKQGPGPLAYILKQSHVDCSLAKREETYQPPILDEYHIPSAFDSFRDSPLITLLTKTLTAM
jgi:hypothetical protein